MPRLVIFIKNLQNTQKTSKSLLKSIISSKIKSHFVPEIFTDDKKVLWDLLILQRVLMIFFSERWTNLMKASE